MAASDLRDLGVEELRTKEHELREELCRLRLKRGTSQLENPMRPRQARRELARVLTILQQAAAKGEVRG